MANTPDPLGNRIRARRIAAKLSLRELAARTGLTASFISQVERGQTNPSIDSLRLIAKALKVSILHFLSDRTLTGSSSPAKSASNGYVPLVKAGARSKLTLPDSGVSYELLTPDLAHKMEAVCGRLAPGAGNVARRLRAPTEEFIFVLSGLLRVTLGTEDHILAAGDTIYFEGTALQRLECASTNQEAVWISVITPAVF